ncbi:hypothetical protein DH2020_011707 [Rehmannia glutinosa]|uniref:SOUL heme-binding protein n=1 Tax=Rehmannia glutinosa TaxID=99300 RepID=A0ABR0XE59_REHGL
MAAFDLFKLSFLVTTLFSGSNLVPEKNGGGIVAVFPPTCNRIECPSYDVIHSGMGLKSGGITPACGFPLSLLMTFPLLTPAELASFILGGKNDNQQKIEMTAPVLTQVKPSDGPFCTSSFVISFYVPKENQATAPSAKNLRLQKWGLTYVAVRQFSGFVMDDDVGKEAAALSASIAGTVWSDAVEKSHKGDNTTEYIVAQYNSPFEFKNRVNEIWLTFDMEDGLAI